LTVDIFKTQQDQHNVRISFGSPRAPPLVRCSTSRITSQVARSCQLTLESARAHEGVDHERRHLDTIGATHGMAS
jgi:hypothetical protein